MTSPAFEVSCDPADESVSGVKVTSNSAGSGAEIAAKSSGTNEDLAIDAKGSGHITLGETSTGQVRLLGGALSLTADSSEGVSNQVVAGAIYVEVTGVENDADDFIVLPSLADVPAGGTITIACNAGGNFEMRTPADSGEKINNTDSDGSQEYLCTDTDVVVVRKISDTDGWTAQSFQISGAVRTAVTPD